MLACMQQGRGQQLVTLNLMQHKIKWHEYVHVQIDVRCIPRMASFNIGFCTPLPGVVQKRDHCHTHLDGLAGLAKRVTISLLPGTGVSWKEWLEDMVVQDTGSVGG